jgi:uncharacterized protein involved in exopolysaccharide biosynthesis
MLNRLPSTSIINPAHDAHSYDLREGVGFLWRQWAFIASIVGAVVLVAAVYVFTTTPRYTAGAQVLLDAPRTKAIKDEDSD